MQPHGRGGGVDATAATPFAGVHRAAAELVRSVSVKLQAALGYDEPCMIMAMLDTSKQARVE